MSSKPDSRERKEATTETRRELYLFSGNECAFPGCTERILNTNGVLIGEICHIYAVKRTASRGEHDLTSEELREPSNLILLCRNHHKEVDDKKLEDEYTVECLQRMKAEHEHKFRTGIEGLERIIDLTERQVVKYPVNFRMIAAFEEVIEEHGDEFTDWFGCETKPFYDLIGNQPDSVRDLIYHILKRGRCEQGSDYGGREVRAVPRELVDSTNLNIVEMRQRAAILARNGLLEWKEVDEDHPEYYILKDFTYKQTGTDLFVELYNLAHDRKDWTILERAIMDLDFTVLSDNS